ncbi:hypothetical protein PPERSA_02914 [Pseudocohnilembus persalinus]|uniref:Uncharacterized protein n=1 Tax=Pseudocohnilembus persalinus TaxID=266149 RepID=A0A0V0QMH7_PSEPJ|nr:hypothetical protein PPERSA_02914 [Pseudocohnilembus persalinus]|eukprot:KRX03535.1 hypothetical protein PPERSA_02914 [Pseudocohnilembus persalinus]
MTKQKRNKRLNNPTPFRIQIPKVRRKGIFGSQNRVVGKYDKVKFPELSILQTQVYIGIIIRRRETPPRQAEVNKQMWLPVRRETPYGIVASAQCWGKVEFLCLKQRLQGGN